MKTMIFKTQTLILLSVLFSFHADAQKFIQKGVITFERKVQLHKILEQNEWARERIDDFPKFYSSNFQLTFNSDSMYYSKLEEAESVNGSWAVYANQNQVFTSFITNQITSKKTIYNDEFLVKDTLASFTWKLINETRTIAGISCKKATTMINDTVFVVAFYAENILVSGGPEQFGGLPGMILGIAIPSMHVSYYAKKVDTKEVVRINIPKQKSKSMTRKEFKEMLIKNMKWAFSNSGSGVLYLFL